jgi:hypothetical protein
MATDKLYTVAGVSTLNGETKARFANDTMRIKVLAKNGHTDITLVELPSEMTKIEAAKFLATLDEFSSADAQEAIGEYLVKHDKQPKAKVEVKKAVKKAVEKKATAPAKSKAEVQAILDTAEDAPF